MANRSVKTFIILVIVLALINAALVFMPQGNYIPPMSDPASKPVLALVTLFSVLVIYGGLGAIGFILSRFLGIPDLLDSRISNTKRFLFPALLGIVLGVVLIVGDIFFAAFNVIGNLIHPPFPTSLVASISAGIGEEMIFRLFFITFWTWIISSVLLRKKMRDTTYWIVAVIAALFFGFAHFPLIMATYGFPSLSTIPVALQIEILLLNGLVGLGTAYFYKKVGFFGAVSVHLWTDIVWHVLYGLL